MRRVILESPYAGDVEANVAYARACLRDCLERGEAPIASHLLYTQPGVLRDDVPEEREWGIAAGLAWSDTFVCDAAVFYTDRGWSKGMLAAKDHHLENGTPIEERTLPGYVAPTPEPDWIGFAQVDSPFEQRMSRGTDPILFQHRPVGSDGEWIDGRPPR